MANLHDLVLLAASTLPDEFHANDVAVSAWQANPGKFSLGDYSHPDVNKAFVTLFGKRSLVKSGLLAKCGPKRYSVTPAGKRRVAALKLGEVKPHKTPVKVLATVFASAAWDKWSSGLLSLVTWEEALVVDVDLPDIEEVVLPDGRSVNKADVEKMRYMVSELRERFKWTLAAKAV